jgi:Ran GTPase-activating protein (RanGAP) involved in mRNA processing and transport
MNNIDDDIEPFVREVLRITNDTFGITLSSNKVSDEVTTSLHEMIRK